MYLFGGWFVFALVCVRILVSALQFVFIWGSGVCINLGSGVYLLIDTLSQQSKLGQYNMCESSL